jgi:hypothetical protein
MKALENELIKQLEYALDCKFIKFEVPKHGDCYLVSGQIVGFWDPLYSNIKRIIVKPNEKKEN